MQNEVILREATFLPKVKTYWLFWVSILLIACVITIPLVIVWLLVGGYFTERYRASLAAVLTDRNLHVKKGVLFKSEKTVPLEKITDLGQQEGPLMRYLGLKGLSVETAGQSGPGSLVSLVGIADSQAFRDAVLEQRDAWLAQGRPVEDKVAPAVGRGGNAGDDATLSAIHASLLRIEKLLQDRKG